MTKSYPQSLYEALNKYGIKPTGDIEWDRAMLRTLRLKADSAAALEGMRLSRVITKIGNEQRRAKQVFPDLTDPEVYATHCKFIVKVANDILSLQSRKFIIDDNNSDILRFLLYYFNECPLAEEVFPGRGYKLHKNIILMGDVGVGKTLLMQVFSEYLRRVENPRYFQCVSVTQVVNHYKLHNNMDLYTYNEESSRGFRINPHHICLNDIGMDNAPFYGVDTLSVMNDFLHARNELWANLAITDRRFTYLTTNLNAKQLTETFRRKDAYGRTVDRFKTFNVIDCPGKSRR